MEDFQRRRLLGFLIAVCCSLLLVFFSSALRDGRQEERRRRNVLLDSTEIPAERIDPAAIDLTGLVNTLVNTSQSGSRQLFSLLSVTSYSSLALHKLTLLVYNISSIKSVESNKLRRRFCYCVTNDTNDLTDFTAVLLDVMGNSTTHLQELFKSASILSVSQRNNSDCIFICVMAGETGREVPELWEVGSITPLFNQTIVEGPHKGNVSSFRLEWQQLPASVSQASPSGMSSPLTSRVQSTAHISPATEAAAEALKVTNALQPLEAQQPAAQQPAAQQPAAQQPAATTTRSATTADRPETTQRETTQLDQQIISLTRLITSTTTQHTNSTAPPTRPSAPPTRPSAPPTRPSAVRPTAGSQVDRRTTGPQSRRTPTPSKSVETEKPGCPWRRPEPAGGGSLSVGVTTVGAHKLQPCVLELCKFFSQCLCGPRGHKTKRFCDDSSLWYEAHRKEVCRRVRRVSFSRSLKQRCVMKMCNRL